MVKKDGEANEKHVCGSPNRATEANTTPNEAIKLSSIIAPSPLTMSDLNVTSSPSWSMTTNEVSMKKSEPTTTTTSKAYVWKHTHQVEYLPTDSSRPSTTTLTFSTHPLRTQDEKKKMFSSPSRTTTAPSTAATSTTTSASTATTTTTSNGSTSTSSTTNSSTTTNPTSKESTDSRATRTIVRSRNASASIDMTSSTPRQLPPPHKTSTRYRRKKRANSMPTCVSSISSSTARSQMTGGIMMMTPPDDDAYFERLAEMKDKYRDEVAIVYRELKRVNGVIVQFPTLKRHGSNNLPDFLVNLKKIIFLLEQQRHEMPGMIPPRKRTLAYLDIVETHIQRKVLPILKRLRATYSTILEPLIVNYLKHSRTLRRF